jgi:TolA-binding protein
MASRLRGGLVAAALSLFALCLPSSAVSQPGELVTARNTAPPHHEDCNKACQEKVRRLDNQVRSLQREVVQLRAEVDRLRNVNLVSTQQVDVAEEEPSPSCDVPYAVDTMGIKRYRPECLEQAALAARAECVNPYVKRADGVTTIKPECLR